MKFHTAKQSGFTLLEILVVVTIIGLISSIAVTIAFPSKKSLSKTQEIAFFIKQAQNTALSDKTVGIHFTKDTITLYSKSPALTKKADSTVTEISTFEKKPLQKFENWIKIPNTPFITLNTAKLSLYINFVETMVPSVLDTPISPQVIFSHEGTTLPAHIKITSDNETSSVIILSTGAIQIEK